MTTQAMDAEAAAAPFVPEPFNLSQAAAGHGVFLIIARRAEGKTTLMRDILRHTPAGVPTALVGLREDQDMHGVAVAAVDSGAVGDCRPLTFGQLVNRNVVLEDHCCVDRKFFAIPSVRDMILNARSRALRVIVIMQYAYHLTSEVAGALDYVFVRWAPVRSDRQRLYRQYFSVFDSFEAFETVLYDTCKDSFAFLVADLTVVARSPEECVFAYTASP